MNNFINDMIALIDKHKNIPVEIRMQLMELTIQYHKAQQDEVREAMKKYRIFYHNINSN